MEIYKKMLKEQKKVGETVRSYILLLWLVYKLQVNFNIILVNLLF